MKILARILQRFSFTSSCRELPYQLSVLISLVHGICSAACVNGIDYERTEKVRSEQLFLH